MTKKALLSLIFAVVMLLKKRSPNRVKADGKANKKEKH